MKRLALTVLVLGGLTFLAARDARAADWYRGYGYSGRTEHRSYHADLEHRDFHRDLDHRDAHRYPMTRWQHGRLHDELEHDAFHDRLEHRSYHGGYGRGFSYDRGGFGYGGRGFSLWFGR